MGRPLFAVFCCMGTTHLPYLLSSEMRAFFGQPLPKAFCGDILIPNFHQLRIAVESRTRTFFVQRGSVFIILSMMR